MMMCNGQRSSESDKHTLRGSDTAPTNLAEVLHGFPQYFYANATICLELGRCVPSCPSQFTLHHHSLISCDSESPLW
jgi:ferredoxin